MSDTVTCYNCEEEFKVEPVFETDAEVCFCPYCGSELDIMDLDEEIEELEDNEDYRD